jgi:hypothetical protein
MVIRTQSFASSDERGQLLVIGDCGGIILRGYLVQEDAVHGKRGVSAGRRPSGIGVDFLFHLRDIAGSFASTDISNHQRVAVGCESGDCGQEFLVRQRGRAGTVVRIDDYGELDVGIGVNPIEQTG